MKISFLASMIASSPVRTHLTKPPISYPPKIKNGATYPSKKVSFVLEEADESSPNNVGILGREITHACSLLIYPNAFDGL